MQAIVVRAISVCAILLSSIHLLQADCTLTCSATVPATASISQSVSFQSTATPCGCSGSATHFWTFGDGADSTSANPSHAYTSAGTYNWNLTVTADSTTCVKSGSIVVGGVTPAAGTYSGTASLGHAFSLTVNGSSQITGWNVSYSDLCSASGSTSASDTCSIVNGTFTCGNASCSPTALLTSISGTFTSSTAVSGTVTLKHQPGFDICCTQTPTFSASNGAAALTASATPDVSTGDAPLTVNFLGSASGGTGPYSYSWDFGDCTAASSAQNPSHVYQAGNWNAVLTVTDSLSATDDAVVPISAVPVGIIVTPTAGLVTSEGGGTASFTVVLQSQPDFDVTIQVDTSDATEGRISTDAATQQNTVTLTFTSANWSTPQTVTLHGQNDDVDDGDVAYTIVTATASSSDASYNGIDPLDVSALNGDNDAAGVTVTPVVVTVAETGTTDEFTVVLHTQPTGDVVIGVVSADTGEATVSPAQLTFTTGDWSTPKVVTVTGADDGTADGDQVTAIPVSMNVAATVDATYDAIDPADVTATTLDDETLTIISTNPAANEKAAPRGANVQATASATVNAATVTQSTFRVQGDQTGRISGAYSATGALLQLDPTNNFKPGELVRVTATSGIQTPAATPLTPRVWELTAATAISTGAMMQDSAFEAGPALNVALGDLDGDGDVDAVMTRIAGWLETVWLNDGSGALTQHSTFGGGDAYGVALGDLDGDGDLDAFVANRLEDDTVWLNNGTGTFSLHMSVSSESTIDVSLGDLDGDGDLDAVLAGQGSATTVWMNDGAANFTAHGTTPSVAGAANAFVLGDLDGDGDLDAVGSGGNGPERVWVNDGTGAFSAHATPSFGGDNTWGIALGDLDGDGDLDVVAANMNGQAQTVWLNNGAGVFTAHGSFGGDNSRGVLLGDLDGDGDLDTMVSNVGGTTTVWLNDGGGTFAPHPSVPAINGGETWGFGLGDLDGDGDLDALLANASGNDTVWLNERVVIAPASGLLTTEAGGTSSFTIVLGRQPSADVTIQMTTSDGAEGRVSTDGATQQTAVDVTFTGVNWSTPRTITLHGRNDDVDDGNVAYTITTAAATSSDPFYSAFNAADVFATNTDDDTAGVSVSTSAVTLTESGDASFTVVLDSQPIGNVVIDVSSGDTSEATVTPAQLTFTTGDWSTPKTVTVDGVADLVIDGDQLATISVTMNTVATADALYDAIDPADVSATIEDDQSFAISSTAPATNAKAASRTTNIAATTTDTVNASTVTQSTFRVQGEQTGRISGTHNVSGASFDLDPTATLKAGELIRVTATNGIMNMTAFPLEPRVWQFTSAGGAATGALALHASSPFGGGWSFGAGLGDLDGDGDLDAIVANPSSENETVWLNNGTGTYSAHPATPSFEAGAATEVALGDLDGDGDLDVVFAAEVASTTWRNDGAGNFSAHPTTPAFGTGSGRDVALGDLDGDGDLDAVIANESGESLTIWRNDGTGSFTAHPTTPGVAAGLVNGISLGDLDADGDLDAVTAGYFGNESVWLNDGAGNFSAHPVTPIFANRAAYEVPLGDVDGDGDLDALLANQDGPQTVYLNDGDGNLSLHSSFGAVETRDAVLGDIDGDSDLDAIAVDNASNSVWLNDGSGTFSAHPATPVFSAGSAGVDLGDVDGDGDLDAFVAEPNADTVWLNRPPGGVTRSPTSVTVAESGTFTTFTVVLDTPPTGNVVIDVASTDTGEATVSPAQLTFTPGNWSSAQTVTVTGVDDALDDGDQASTITLTMNAAATADGLYDLINPADVAVTTTDNDVGPPPSFAATATTTSQVALTWGAVDGATSYEIYRTSSLGSAYALVTAVAGTSHTDTGLAANTTYLYKVRAIGGGGPSGYSAIDPATTIIFTDATLSSSVVVKAVHVTQLRSAVNAMRATAGLSAASFTDATLSAVKIKRIHVVELRNALNDARAELSLSALTYTDPTITATSTRVKAAHFTELRGGVQ